MTKLKDLTGHRFSRLLVLERKGREKCGAAKWRCVCECGGEVVVVGYSLTSGRTASCGCLQREVTAATSTTHGLGNSKIYKVWNSMKQRCDNPLASHYEFYGGRGITYDPSWASFENFLKDMGESYKEQLSLDRVDSSKGYSKENCRWATRSVQNRNRRKRAKSKNPFIGVKKIPSGKFAANITVDRKVTHLGTFTSAIEAATAYDNAVEPLIGNRPNGTTKNVVPPA